MLTYLRSSLFDSPAQTLTNTVNTVGVMGKGIAKQFKEKFPEMFVAYKALCESRQLKTGNLHLWRGSSPWILNFPTKTTWKRPSEISYIEDGLACFVANYEKLGITSISFPPLGCGNGNLDWRKVKPIMERYLGDLQINIFIHDLHVGAFYVPEHLEIPAPFPPTSINEFCADIRACIEQKDGTFKTISNGRKYAARMTQSCELSAETDDKKIRVPYEDIEKAWLTLQLGLLTNDQYASENDRKTKSYLFPVLMALPYINFAEFQRIHNGSQSRGHASCLFVDPQTILRK